MTYDPSLTWEENCKRAEKVETNFPRIQVVSDIEPYQSPVDGGYVGGRAARRNDLKKHGCVPYEPMKNRPKGIGNPRFAKKHGLKLNEEAVHRERAKRIDPLAAISKL